MDGSWFESLIQENTLLRILADASLVVWLVMLGLLLISVISWWMIVRKRLTLTRMNRQMNQFEDSFWSGIDLSALYHGLQRRRGDLEGFELVFSAGFQEFMRLKDQLHVAGTREAMLTSAERAMRAAVVREQAELEQYLPSLATAGSTSPYIGLFGTVWGIMNAFLALADAQQAGLTQVAPGIAEALVATAMGLFAAIPATIAYNRYSHEVDQLLSRYDTFVDEFANVLQRQLLTLGHQANQASVIEP